MPRTDNRRQIGALGEAIAGRHLERAGYSIVERNARRGRLGELDIVATGGGCLVFCEVKTRIDATRRGPDGPLDAIGPAKRRRLRRLAGDWLGERGRSLPRLDAIRFDVIGVTVSADGGLLALEHIENAF